MRVARLIGAVLAILTTGLLVPASAGAQPPAKLTDHVTDSVAALTDPGRAAVVAAIDRLYRNRHIQLWVVYVDNFSRFKPDNWAERTRGASAMGDHDALLAVATNTKLYAFSVPPNTQGVTAAELDGLRNNQIGPAVAVKDWSGAAVAAADGLNKSASTSKPMWLPIAIGVGVLVLMVVLFLVLIRVRHRRRAARRVAPADGQASVDDSSGQALSTADTRLRQISDYVTRHHDSVGAAALARFDEAKRHLAAARGKEASTPAEAIAHANRASALAAQAQTLANTDVLAVHRPTRGRGTGSPR
ncbi:transmembrane protein [Mycobacterium europaeum]|uniref:Transmembrane protein n=1 Tax=Mycobacterium europaeum TaxID=761804 RepID=A0A0U1DK38_9MYCO|nr:TPM domain-containing protein [Mycobacterium europaeum]CQD18023.1 transmembrane protein [Mycobacterium europaeum]